MRACDSFYVRAEGADNLTAYFSFLAMWVHYLFRCEVKRMKKAILALGSLGVVTLLIAMAPDIRRYLRMRCM